MIVAKILSAQKAQNVKVQVWSIVLARFGRNETPRGAEVQYFVNILVNVLGPTEHTFKSEIWMQAKTTMRRAAKCSRHSHIRQLPLQG